MIILFFLYLTKIYVIMVMLKAVLLLFSEYHFNTIESFYLKFSNLSSCKKHGY